MTDRQRKLTETQWKTLRPKCKKAAQHSHAAMEAWATVSAEAVSSASHINWRWMLADMRERCFDANIECPYTVTYLVQLAETYDAVKGDFDRGVPASVLVEGRNLDNLLDIVEDGMTVGRMKAIVFKEANDDERSVEEIEAEQKRHRTEQRDRQKLRGRADEIARWPAEKADDLLPALKDELSAYIDALTDLTDEDIDFNAADARKTLRVATALTEMLKELTPPIRRAA